VKFILLPTVASLVDRHYERESLLLHNELNSFTPSLRLIEKQCESQEELEEYRAFFIAGQKSMLGSDHMIFAENLERLRQDARQRHEKTKNIWDLELTMFTQRIKRMEVENPKYLENKRQECGKLAAKLFAHEAPIFTLGLSHHYSEHEPNARINLYREVMERNAGKLGFTYDKKLSGKGKPIFSKLIIDDWRLGFVIDVVNLKVPVCEPYVQPGNNEVFRAGPFLELPLNIFHVPAGSRRGEIKQGIRFEALFPINSAYRRFYTLMELEALVNIYLRMYKLIATELEAALVTDVNAHLKLTCL